ncbi:hypothetical protein [Gaoshiqia sediminis]|uniref:Uncharacterized protein n=1 Tax=Gaoshiqia sediminis TaxID=2986998 RepID=A0AA41Y4W5_9BACT|nr:hypothetical protein [Gaoshiqia sediminis]MCW0483494.1 hypothetical protein [Gaoshiqia sediminis]
MTKIEYAQQAIKHLANIITGFESTKWLGDMDLTLFPELSDNDANKILELRVVMDDLIEYYGTLSMSLVSFLESNGVDPYPLDSEWWELKANREWAKRWGIKRAPWYIRIFDKSK